MGCVEALAERANLLAEHATFFFAPKREGYVIEVGVCTPRPERRISLVSMYLANCPGGRRRELSL